MTPEIKKRLTRVRLLLQIQKTITWSIRGFAFAAIAVILFFIAGKFASLGLDLITTSAFILAAGTLAGLIVSFVRPVSMFDAAFACDNRLGLRERLTSAIEFESSVDINPLVPALIRDAENHAMRIRPSRDFSLRFPREAIYAVILILITVGLYFVPPWQYVFASDEERQEFTQIQAEAENIRDIARQVRLEPPTQHEDLAEQIADALEELAEEMEFGTLSRREALQQLADIEELIEQVEDEEGYNELKDQLDSLADALDENEALSETADALGEGDIEKAQEALEELSRDIEEGRVPMEEYEDIANSLEQASDSLGDSAESSSLGIALQEAAEQLRSASEGNPAGESVQESANPSETAQQLIDMINNALPELQDLDIDEDVISEATEMLEEIRDDLQEALDNGTISEQDIREAEERIQEVSEMLEDAGADFSSEQDSRTPEQIAGELIREAERLENACPQAENLTEEQREQLAEQCRQIAEELQEQVGRNSCSNESNQSARERLDEIREQLGEGGCSQEEMGEQTDCSGGEDQGDSNQGNQSGQQGGGMQSLFGSQSQSGMQSGQFNPSGQQSRQASDALRSLARSMGQCQGNCEGRTSLEELKQRVGQCRSSMCCGNSSGQSNSASQGPQQGWGTGHTSEESPEFKNVDPPGWEDRFIEGETPNNTADFEETHSSEYDARGQGWDTMLSGENTGVGESFVFTREVDPQTGDVSIIPDFDVEIYEVEAVMDAIEDQDIPRAYEDFVRFYFEMLARASSDIEESD